MKTISFKKITAFALSLLMLMTMLPMSVFADDPDCGWNLEKEYASGRLKIDAYSYSTSDITLKLNGFAVEGGEVTEKDGKYTRRFTIDTSKQPDGTANIELFIGGASAASKDVFFDNTQPYIRSWEATDALGHKYTAYDMEVVPNDIIVLGEDEKFLVDFYPTDDGSGVASVTATIDGKTIPLPFWVEYDLIPAGMHTMTYKVYDMAGNIASDTFSFETRKPAPTYSDMSTETAQKGYRLSACLSGTFSTYSAKFCLAEILPTSGVENITNGDISALHPQGERDFRAQTDGGFLTETADGGELYQCFNVDVSGKTGKIYADCTCELNVGDVAEVYLYSAAKQAWVLVQEKTSVTGVVSFSIGKRGVDISDYSVDNVMPVRVRVVSDNDAKYIKTTEFVSGIRYNSQIGTTQTGANGTSAVVVYTGTVTPTMGWYVTGTADLYYSYSPIHSFAVAPSQEVKLKHFSAVFNGDTASRISVSWQTDRETKTHLQMLPYGELYPDFSSISTKNYTGNTSYVADTGMYSHKIRVTGLTPGAKYWMRYGDKTLNVWSSPCIVEMSEKDGGFTFAAASPGGSTADINAVWNGVSWTADPEFIVTTGDEAAVSGGWDGYFESVSRVVNNIRFAPAAGPSGSSEWWTKYNISEQSGAGHASGIYYSFNYQNVFFAVLNSNDLNAAGELNSAQLRWANKVFAADGSDWKVLVLNASVDGADTPLANQLRPLLDTWGVDVVITSGGAGLTGELGADTFDYGGIECYSDYGVQFISTDEMGTAMALITVDDLRMHISCGKKQVDLFSSGRFDAVNARIAALPDAESITLSYLAEVQDIRAICDSSDSVLVERFVVDIEKLAAAEKALADLIAITPPDITVSAALPKKALLESTLVLPGATAEDMTDGSVDVVISVDDPDGENVFDSGSVTFTKYGDYTVRYTATDADGNVAETTFTVTVREYTKHDFNRDGVITVADALVALRFAAQMLTPDTLDIAVGDHDGDGEITVADALSILRIAIGLTDR